MVLLGLVLRVLFLLKVVLAVQVLLVAVAGRQVQQHLQLETFYMLEVLETLRYQVVPLVVEAVEQDLVVQETMRLFRTEAQEVQVTLKVVMVVMVVHQPLLQQQQVVLQAVEVEVDITLDNLDVV